MCRILFIDDDARLTGLFVEAAEEAGFKTHHLRGPDQALEYLEQPDTVADVIVWDMMISPGERFRGVDTEAGLSTGRHLYPAMRKLRPHAHYILLTARGDVSFADFDSPGTNSHVRFKESSAVEDLVRFIKELVSGLPPEEPGAEDIR